jgi:hypothetical protein
MRARVFRLRNALLLRKAPATERDFNVLRTALDLTVAFSVALDVAVRVALRVAFRLELVSALLPTDLLRVLRVIADRLRVLRAVERTTLRPELDRADERDIVGRALTRAPPPPRATPPACAAPPLA